MSSSRKKVFVGLSGGVDSSVAALLLKNSYYDSHGRIRITGGGEPEARYSRAYDVVGVFMRCYNLDGCAEQDAEDARRVAGHIGIPFYVWDFEEEYKKRVVDYMVEGYRAGITPNPDVMCNREIKFGLFFEKARAMGADYIATGHYVRLRRDNANLRMVSESTNPVRDREGTQCASISNGTNTANPKIYSRYSLSHSYHSHLYTAVDGNKDQSYFLWTLTQSQLAHCLFPIGDYQKSKVRVIARKAGLPTAEKKDSQGICFLGKVAIADFLRPYIPEHPGKVLTVSGKVIGTHRGAEFYTIGQRHIGVSNGKWKMEKGKGSDGKSTVNAQPIYVASKNIKTNTLIVAQGDEDPSLYRKEIRLKDINVINQLPMTNYHLPVFARVRYRQPLSAAVLTTYDKKLTTDNGKEMSKTLSRKLLVVNHASLVFDKPQKFVAAGQSAVFYTQSREMLGGGIII